MIYDVIQTITDGLNIFFKTRLRTIEDKAVISGIVNQDGSVAQLEENKVLITLAGIEKEPTNFGPKKDGKQRVHINFYLLFSCYFSNANYSESLKFLDFTMNFLNDNSSMDITEGGGLKSTSSSGGLKVQIEIESLSLDQTSNLWSAIGAKLMPSALYKIRMIPLDSNSLTEFRPSAAAVSGNSKQIGGGSNTNQGSETGQGDNNSGTNQTTTSKESSSATTSPTTPPPQNTRGKRPLVVGGEYARSIIENDNDDGKDAAEIPDQNSNAPAWNFNPSSTEADNLPNDSAAEVDEASSLNDQPDDNAVDEPAKKTNLQGDNQNNDLLNKVNPLNKSQGSLFSPFALPKKPADSNLKAQDTDPNKNLNKDSDTK